MAPGALEAAVAATGFLLDLLDRLPEVVFFMKDGEGRYRAVNRTLVERLGRKDKSEVLGRTARDVFPPPLGDRYLDQDLAVCRGGREIVDLLELHLYPDRREGWCLTTKVPLRDREGQVIGLVGLSRDAQAPLARGSLEGLARALDLVHERYDQPLRVEALAARARLSPYQFTRRVRALFGLTPRQLVIRTRIDAARRMLREERASIGEIALACGYCDQSAFTRQFRAVVGLTPAQYREGLEPRR
jgi:AraC-like DNA-binding protein